MTTREPLREDAIKYWPRHERPRERLLKHGPESLSDAELLAIFLRTGVSGRSAVDLARALLQRFQGLRGLFAADYRELRAVKGLGDAKIATLLATIELSKRYLREQLEQRRAIRNPDDVYQLLAHSMRDLDREVFTVLFPYAESLELAAVHPASPHFARKARWGDFCGPRTGGPARPKRGGGAPAATIGVDIEAPDVPIGSPDAAARSSSLRTRSSFGAQLAGGGRTATVADARDADDPL